MASSKEMMKRAAAKRAQQESAKLKTAKLQLIVSNMHTNAGKLLEVVPNQDYTSNKYMSLMASKIAAKVGCSNNTITELHEARAMFEDQLTAKYGVTFTFGMGAFLVDQEAMMKKANVPQQLRVTSGLFDTVISKMMIESGQCQVETIYA